MQNKPNVSINNKLWKFEANAQLSHLINDLVDFNTLNQTQHFKIRVDYSVKNLLEYTEWKKEEPKNDNSLDSYFRVFSLTLCSDTKNLDNFYFSHLAKNYYRLLGRKVPYWEGIVGFKNPPQGTAQQLETVYRYQGFDIEIIALDNPDQVIKVYNELFENQKFKYQNHDIGAAQNHEGYIEFYTKLQTLFPKWNVLKHVNILDHNNKNLIGCTQRKCFFKTQKP